MGVDDDLNKKNEDSSKKLEDLWKQFMNNRPTLDEFRGIYRSTGTDKSFVEKSAIEVLNWNPDWENCPDWEDYFDIIKIVPTLANQAWQKFLNTSPKNEVLVKVLDEPAFEPFYLSAASRMLYQKPTSVVLKKIADKVPKLKNIALKMLFTQYDGDKTDLHYVIEAETEFKEEAAILLHDHNEANISDQCRIVEHCQEYAVAMSAAEKIIEEGDKDDLSFIITKFPPYKKEATEKILKIKAGWSNLGPILLDDDLQTFWEPAAKQILPQENVDDLVLRRIIEKLPKLREETTKKLWGQYKSHKETVKDLVFLLKYNKKLKEEIENYKRDITREILLNKIKRISAEK